MFTELWAPVLDLYKILKQTTIFHAGDWELHSLVCVVLFLSLLSILKGKNSSHACWWYGYSQQTDCGRSPWTQGAVANCGGHEAALSLGLEWNMVPLCHLSLLLIGECPAGGCGCPQSSFLPADCGESDLWNPATGSGGTVYEMTQSTLCFQICS